MSELAPASVIARIQKLLQAAQYAGDGTRSEAEAELAMKRAQELLAKHNLDMAIVQSTQVAGGTVQVEEKRERTRISRSAQYRWQRDLWRAISEANFCWWSLALVYEGKRGTKKVTSKVRVKRHMILGRESNVISVRMMGEYLEDAIERLVVESGGYQNKERMSRSANSWKEGPGQRPRHLQPCELQPAHGFVRRADRRNQQQSSGAAVSVRCRVSSQL